MSKPFQHQENTDDLHTLMAIAVLCGHRSVETDVAPMYATRPLACPTDALGGIGRGLHMIGNGKPRDGYRLIEETARAAISRTDQAQDVLAALQRDMRTLVNN